MTSQCALLNDRSMLRISGADARHFLQGIVTCDVDGVEQGDAAFGALLTPQGKILFDFFLIRTPDGYLVDTPDELAGELARRLGFYKLRAKVDIETDEAMRVTAYWGDRASGGDGLLAADPRNAEMGWRRYGAVEPAGCDGDYEAHRIALGMPQGGNDFSYGDAFPHDALMDQMNAVAFTKGCFIGQEVVSRMRHRGTARKRVIMVEADAPLPDPQTPVTASGKPAGELGSVDGQAGLAMLRLDRVKNALDAGEPVLAGDIPVRPRIQPWASFDWPSGKDGD